MISIYQRSVPAHPMKRKGRADPTICIAGCSKRKGKKGMEWTRGCEVEGGWQCQNRSRRDELSGMALGRLGGWYLRSVRRGRWKQANHSRSWHSCIKSAEVVYGKQFRALRLLRAITSSLSPIIVASHVTNFLQAVIPRPRSQCVLFSVVFWVANIKSSLKYSYQSVSLCARSALVSPSFVFSD